MTRSGFCSSSSSAILPLDASRISIALGGQSHPQQFADRRLVIDDQNPEREPRSCGGVQLLGLLPGPAA